METLKDISKELVTVQEFHWERADQSPEAGFAHSVGYLPLSDTNKARFWALWTEDPPGAHSKE